MKIFNVKLLHTLNLDRIIVVNCTLQAEIIIVHCVVHRTLDIQERKKHIPVVDRTPLEPPPILVAVVGPPKVGKTTLIQCLIKNFTRQKVSHLKGPVTIVSGKKRRLTFIECINDINSMIDIAKIADLVSLLP